MSALANPAGKTGRLGPGLLAALVVLPFALPLIADAAGYPAATALATRILIYGMAAASLNLVLGYGGLVSFGHAAFFGLGGYVVAILAAQQAGGAGLSGSVAGSADLLVALPAAIVVSGLAAAAIGALSLRTSGVQFIMITLAFAQMLFHLFVSLDAYGGEDGLSMARVETLAGHPLGGRQSGYYLALVAALAFFAIFRRVVCSPSGQALAGLRQNERRMAALGLPPYRYKLAAFVLSGMGAGLAGGLLAAVERFVSPDTLQWTTSGELMVMVVLGGAGTLFGPLLGAGLYLGLETALGAWTENWQLLLGSILLAVVLASRGGLGGLVARLSKRPPW